MLENIWKKTMREPKLKFFIDSNVFIRIFVGDVESQMRECLELLNIIEQNNKIKAYISKVIVLEVGWVLGGGYYKFSKKKVVEALKSMEIKNLHWADKVDFNIGLNIFEKYNVKLGDAMIVANEVIQKDKAVIVSYDKDFDKIAEVTRMTPGEVLRNVISEQ